MNSQQQKGSCTKTMKATLLLVIAAAIVTLSVAPNITKPLFVKYYRAVYQVEAVKTL